MKSGKRQKLNRREALRNMVWIPVAGHSILLAQDVRGGISVSDQKNNSPADLPLGDIGKEDYPGFGNPEGKPSCSFKSAFHR
jgi:hypothetical protein